MAGPLTRRIALTVDDDDARPMSPSALARWTQRQRERDAQRDMEQRREGAFILADYGGSPADALRAYLGELFESRP